jgi:hypothetical protein
MFFIEAGAHVNYARGKDGATAVDTRPRIKGTMMSFAALSEAEPM